MINKAKVVSAFDGMACGMLAMMEAGVQVDRYVAYEIDKYAVKTSSHNFPDIEHNGDVFQADFNKFSGFDFLVGGSPCTYWSIAQKNNRETVASGMGWELFSQYVRALHEAKPKFFIPLELLPGMRSEDGSGGGVMGCIYGSGDNCKKDNRPCIFSEKCFIPKPMTNADRIRQMSNEELSEMIADNIHTGACNDFGIPGKNPCPNGCTECVLEWLKKPVEVE